MAHRIERPVKHAGPQRRDLLVTAVFILAPFSASAQQPWKLITPDEEARDNVAPQAPPPDFTPAASIDLVRPDISRPIRNPATIEVRFSPGPGQSIDMATFNATYGLLGINITRRLLDRAVVTANGLAAENVELPAGSHRVTMSIADTSGKRASRTFSFSVSA